MFNHRGWRKPKLTDAAQISQITQVQKTPICVICRIRGPFPGILILAGLLGWFPRSASAELPAPRLISIFRPGGQAGTTFKAVFSGKDLDAASAIHFSRPGVSARFISGTAFEANFELTVAPGVPCGPCDARVVGAHGISNVRAIWVGAEREVAAVSDNTSADKATLLEVNTATAARCADRAMQFYSVLLHGGRHVVIECITAEIDSRMAPVILLNDPSGREVARSRRGGILDFTAPTDGRYVLCVHDLLFRGGAEFVYHLAVSTRPHLDFIFPPVARPGTKTKYVVYGRNLPGGSKSASRSADGAALEQLEVEISVPPLSMTESMSAFQYRLGGEAGLSNPVTLALGDFQSCGRFPGAGRANPFEFSANKGDQFWVEILSDRLGVPAAPDLLIQRIVDNAKGGQRTEDVREVNGVDPGSAVRVPTDGLPTRDVAFALAISQTGTYRITPRNLFESSDNYLAAYALSAAPATADFELTATAPVLVRNTGQNVQPTGGIALRRGGTYPIDLSLYRRGGFEDEVQVTCESLPEGVTASGIIPASQNEGVLFLSASKSASPWAGTVRILARATTAHGTIARQAGYRTIVWGATSQTETPQLRACDDFAFAVTDEPAPFTIAVASGKSATLGGGRRLHVPLRVEARGEIASPLQIKPLGLQQLLALQATAVSATKNEATFDADLGQALRPGKHVLYLEVTGTVRSEKKGGPTFSGTFYSEPIIVDTTRG
jgi:hypothetical protein